MELTDAQRDFFDRQVDHVLRHLPPRIHELLEEVPLVVDDRPSPRILREMGIEEPDELCGLYRGTPLIHREAFPSGLLPDNVTLFRLGILREAGYLDGQGTVEELRRQIRITLLHELGHYHGLDEDDLEALGYG